LVSFDQCIVRPSIYGFWLPILVSFDKSKKDGQFIGQKKKDKHWSIKHYREQEKEHKPFG
jgi:hypothetical protein